MSEIWITSDLHLFHDRDFLYTPRGFSGVYEMNEAIMENWNKTVGRDDIVYCLGDLMLNDTDGGIKLLKQLNGHINIARGNHDTDDRAAAYYDCYNVANIEYGYPLKVGKWRFHLCHYPTLVGNYDDEKAPTRQLYNLCGHTHTQNKWEHWDLSRIYHCELDAHNNTPVNIEQVIYDIKEKINV